MEECNRCFVDESTDSGFPHSASFCVIVHDSTAVHEHSRIVGPRSMVYRATVHRVIGTIEYAEIGVNKSNGSRPVINLDSPIRIRLVAGVSRKPSGDLEEGSVGDSVFVVIACIV